MSRPYCKSEEGETQRCAVTGSRTWDPFLSFSELCALSIEPLPHLKLKWHQTDQRIFSPDMAMCEDSRVIVELSALDFGHICNASEQQNSSMDAQKYGWKLQLHHERFVSLQMPHWSLGCFYSSPPRARRSPSSIWRMAQDPRYLSSSKWFSQMPVLGSLLNQSMVMRLCFQKL